MNILQEEKCCCDQRFVVLLNCMNEQLKCMEMLLRNFLYSLEHCIAPRGTSISSSYCKQHL